MNFLVIASVIVAITVLLGVLIAVLMAGLDRLVKNEREKAQEDRESRNPNITLGHDIPVSGDYEKQLKEARKLAALQAANTPRGGNLGIGSLGNQKQPTALEAAKNDPVTAVKIARFHGWSGARSGITSTATAAAVAKAPSETVAPEKSASDLVPGVDYPVIEITDEMSPAEKRKARIANAKAKSAAAKALKEAGPQASQPVVAAAPSPSGDAVPATAEPVATAAAASTTAGTPTAGIDYPIIELTDDMTPEEKRKARISNAKAKSAAMKQFKSSGGQAAAQSASAEEASNVETVSPVASASPRETVAEPASPNESAIPASIPQPNFIEITDDMSPEEQRKARINNAKEKSAYNRALKAAGIDPSSLS